MNASSHTKPSAAAWRGLGMAGASMAGFFAIVGGHPDGGFGLVVVDQGNPRRVGGIADVPFAAPI